MPDYEEHPGILERLESDVDLSPALVPYTRDTVDLTSALTDQRKPWAGDYLYVESLKGQLQLKFNSRDAFALTVREGEVYRLPFQQVYVSTAGNSAWGTASIVV
ncbi:MAG: hypothetical protein GWN18_17390, partial [Thermoplasmata archaeon]|nr:hypothetical protein [Thermoplasmata archaeon]NIT79328.1 hypothetical protein [Thermoplasmata archaeon]NIU50766.1 hypothetical protein [Thermoplasmata archaeon]NIV80486.1 hypothetical protein [Thermoplasmata archaeon]NIW84291.1 hypothetical protein [Thermoplasmata archaeon]